MYDRIKLLKLREKRGLTQYELAEKAGISVVTLNKIETSDMAKPFASTLKKIALALGVGIEELSDENDDQRVKKDIYRDINSAMRDRKRIACDLMEIDSFMFRYINKQLDIFKRDLGMVFGIPDSMLLEASLFSGLSWSRRGNTTHETNYPKVLGDLLALQNVKISIDRVDICLKSVDEIKLYSGVAGIYGIMDTEGNMLRIGESKDIADRLLGQNGHIIALKNEEYPTMKEYINGNDEFGADYYFTILAIEPNVGRKLTSLQSDTWRYYAETKLIIEEKTYLKGNRYKENAIFTGDKYIPIKVQKEMMHYYYEIDLE